VRNREDVPIELRQAIFIPVKTKTFFCRACNVYILSSVILEWLLKGIVVVVLFLLNLLGWKRADKWLDKIVGAGDKEERPVV
jgi:hypothetical protein